MQNGQVYPIGLDEEWGSSYWDVFKGGVKVSFAPFKNSDLYLLRPEHWNCILPEFSLAPGQVIRDVVNQFFEYLKKNGIKVETFLGAVHVSEAYSDGNTFRVLVMVPCTSVGPISKVERVTSGLVLSGLAVSNPMWRLLPELLGWEPRIEAEQPTALAA